MSCIAINALEMHRSIEKKLNITASICLFLMSCIMSALYEQALQKLFAGYNCSAVHVNLFSILVQLILIGNGDRSYSICQHIYAKSVSALTLWNDWAIRREKSRL
jgi:hypothetical protein